MDERSEMERSISDAVKDKPRQKVRTECHRRVFLFNCDRTYSLDSVEKLLHDMKGDIGQELSFDIVKTYFRLSEMSHVAEKTVPDLQMDVAFLVFHANESCLAINVENAGIGYAKIYKALLQATDGKVLIVIGGDDHYKSTDEEESSVISRWARRKVSYQFKDEFLDGRKSFIFSWNKIHRKIHEEALLRYFDPNKSGQKFEWKPNERRELPQDAPHKTPENEKLKGKERDQNTDRPNAMDGAQSSSEKDVNRVTSVSEARCTDDKEDKLKEERKKDTERKNLKDNVNEPSDECTTKIASRKTTETKDELSSHLRDVGTISTDDFVLVTEDDLNGFSEEQLMNGKTNHGTLVMKTVIRNGSFSFKEDEMSLNPKWIPPGEFLLHISEQLKDVAGAEVEIFHKEETGALSVIIREDSNLSHIIEYFYNMVTGMFDRVDELES